ncbi:nucleotide-binding protein [Caproicibacter fermentans]|uniref:ATP-binding protein n=1 Tax=Caproicibacter fermentans TaxID=2576756 RepID=A0A7G8T8J3_9FIRM|nr:ATP-binding protein [Caproicibacter fermentans]QNK39934.1 ATP-binding protein [Caproicibacter fermentans]
MRIAVLSGKGGTGKTLVSVNLACAAEKAVYVDCDVEEPNGHLFLKPEITEKQSVTVAVPEIDMSKCTGCRKCVDFCKYNALALLQDRLMIFYEVCHSCGGCILFCPAKALTKKQREIGTIEIGNSDNVTVLTGCLNTGEVSGVPIIKGLMGKLPEQDTIVIDCPPGSACIVMESIREADFCVLVAEPTLFGAHNLEMVYELVKLFNKPFGVVLNKCLPGENPSKKFCEEKKINILAEIPYDENLGRLNSKGLVAVRESGQYYELFRNLLYKVAKEALQ